MPDVLISEQEAAARINALIEEQVDAQIEDARFWTKELEKIDPDLSLCWVPESATDPEITPGRWHIRRKLPRAVDALWPLEGPHGEYRAPGSWMIDEIRRSDMWDGRRRQERREVFKRMDQAKKRDAARLEAQRRDEISLAYRAASRLRGDGGMKERTDLKQPKYIKDEKAAKA